MGGLIGAKPQKFFFKISIMQIKIFTIPILGGEVLNDEMNRFLRSKTILQTENQLINHPQGVHWCFCIKYLDGIPENLQKPKVDYKELLDDASFQRFSRMREIRKQIAKKEAIPAYAVFTDEELAELAKTGELDAKVMSSIKGIGEKKVEKYGKFFLTNHLKDEKSQ
jgi:superfamily II DNA helicase RecQ